MHYYLPFLVEVPCYIMVSWWFIHLWRKPPASNKHLFPWIIRHIKPVTVVMVLLSVLQICHSFTQIRRSKIEDFNQALQTHLIARIEQSPAHKPGTAFTRESVFTSQTADDGLLLSVGFHADLPGDEDDVRVVNALLDETMKNVANLRQQWANELPCYVPDHFHWMNSYRFNNGSQISRTFDF